MSLRSLLLLLLVLHAPRVAAQGFDLPYADSDPHQLFDWYAPSSGTGPHPVVVFIHGGLVDKSVGAPAPGNMTQLFTSNGVTVMSIDFHPYDELLYPAQLEDAATAVQFFREHAASFDIDASRLAVSGVSFGAVLGGWLAYGPDLAQPGGSPQQQQSTRPQVLLNEIGLTNFLLMVPSFPWNFPGGPTLATLTPEFLKSVSFSEMVGDVPRDFTPPVASFYDENENPPPLTDPHDVTLMKDLHAKLQISFPDVAAQSQMLRQHPWVMDNYYEQRVAWLLLRLGIGHQLDLGKSLPGSGGVAPALQATGDWLPGGLVQISFQASTPGATTVWLVMGKQAVNLPLKGGTLVPKPSLVIPLQTSAEGTFVVPAVLPASVPLGADFYLQCWQLDAGGPAGFAASNAVVGILIP